MTTRITVSLLLIAVLLTAASATVFADGPPEDDNEPVDQQQVETQETAPHTRK